MYVTLTLNPSLDVVYSVPEVRPGRLHRSETQTVRPGGKGVNVAIMARRLGAEVRALGFSAGVTGTALAGLLEEEGITAEFQRLERGLTRVNAKVLAAETTQFNGPGPQVDEAALDGLLGQLAGLGPDDTLVVAGAPPAGDAVLERILRAVAGGPRLVVDVPDPWLRPLLAYHPWLIKPNRGELGRTLGPRATGPDTLEIAVGQAREVQGLTGGWVVVSLGGSGALAVGPDGAVITATPPPGVARNPVGAGDALLAGYLVAWDRWGDPQTALAWGVAAGTATTYHGWLAPAEAVAALVRAVQLTDHVH